VSERQSRAHRRTERLHRARSTSVGFPARRNGLFDRATRRVPTSDAPSPPGTDRRRLRPPARPSDRDRFRRRPGERASDFHNPERLSSDEEPVRALPVTRRRASAAPRSRRRLVHCGFPRWTRPLLLRSAATERSFGDQAPLIDSATILKDGHAANAVSWHATEAFHSVAPADARKRRLPAARPCPFELGLAHPKVRRRTGRWLPTQLARCGAEANSEATWTSRVSPARDDGALRGARPSADRPRLALGPTARTNRPLGEPGCLR
jgi:hypothetical protein